jgi:hypothetical protein
LRRIAVLLFILALLVAAGAAAATDAKRAVFEDRRGENPGGLDVTRVTVSNDDTGRLTFRAAIPALPRLTADMRFRLWIDSDYKQATGLAVNGTALGMDHFLLHEAGRTQLYRCDRDSCTNATIARTLRFSYASGPRFRILDAEIRSPKRLRFALEATTGLVIDPVRKLVDVSRATYDDAPDRPRTWVYVPAKRVTR